MMINEQTGMKLLEYFKYDYRQFAVVVWVLELSEGIEAKDRLLEGITAPQVKRNVEHFVGQLRQALDMEEPVAGG